MMMVTVVSLAKTNDEKKPVTNVKSSVVKQLTDESLPNADFSQFVKNQQKQSAFHKNGYLNPVTDSSNYLKVFYPEPEGVYYLGENMSVNFEVKDTWKYYFTCPVSGVFDSNDQIVETKSGDVANVSSPTKYNGSIYLDPAKYQPGRYKFYICNAPCYESGNLVDDWSSWSNIPSVLVNFEIKCKHSWDAGLVTRQPTCTTAGARIHTCSMCHETKTESIPANGHKWNNYYTIERNPSYTSAGSKSIHCSVCGVVKGGSVVSIPMLQKKANTMTANASKKVVKFKKLKKKAVTVKSITVRNAVGKVSYKLAGGNAKGKKALSLNKKNGKIKVKKKTKKGTYFIKVRVTAAGSIEFNPLNKTVKVVVKVK